MATTIEFGKQFKYFGRVRSEFDEHVTPILRRLYGKARTTLGSQFGVHYETVDRPDGSQATRVPGLHTRIDDYANRLPRTGIWDVSGIDRPSWYFALMGWYLTEGSCCYRQRRKLNPKPFQFVIAQEKPRGNSAA